MTIIPEPPGTNGHVHLPKGDLPSRMAERYAAGATLDELAVEFRMPRPAVGACCWRLALPFVR